MPSDDLRVFGDTAKFRRKLQQRIRTGEHLLDELIGARDRLGASQEPTGDGLLGRLGAAILREAAVGTLDSRTMLWSRANHQLLSNHLGSAGDGLLHHRMIDRRSVSPAAEIDSLEADIQEDLVVLRQILGRLPVRRNVGAIKPVGIRLDELWLSNLLEPDLLRSYEHRLTSLGSRANVSGAIGAAKELTESVLKAVLQRLGEPAPRPRDDFLTISGLVRVALKVRLKQAAPDPDGIETSDKFQAHLGGLLQDLDEWRNLYGTGHGRRKLPSGLASRHGRLAIDAAEAYVRFLVTTLDDIGLLL
jgi:hypothetical protein